MLIALVGGSCTGKSAVAEQLAQALGAPVTAGKDYLRLAKSEQEAERLYRAALADAVSGADRIAVIAEPEQLALLPEGAFRVLVSAPLETVKARFAARMGGGKLPPMRAAMLERKQAAFAGTPCDLALDTGASTPQQAAAAVLAACGR